MAKKKSQIGLDIGSHSLKVVELLADQSSTVVKNIGLYELPTGSLEQTLPKGLDTLLEKNMIVYKIKGMMNFIDTFNFIFLMGLLVISYDYFNLPLSEIVVFLFLLFRLVPLLKSVNVEKIEINARLESALKIKSFIGENSKNIKFILN